MKMMELWKIINDLKDIRRIATMDTAKFSTWCMPFNSKYRKEMTSDELNDIIKTTTEMWRVSYIISPLDVLIEKLEKEYVMRGGLL